MLGWVITAASSLTVKPVPVKVIPWLAMVQIGESFQLHVTRFSKGSVWQKLMRVTIPNFRFNSLCLRFITRKCRTCLSRTKRINPQEVWRLEKRQVALFMFKALRNTQLTLMIWFKEKQTKATIIDQLDQHWWTKLLPERILLSL